ncbi:hypothetical protein VHA_001967 [Grimontia hollisae CIP 101886]|uniref:Uncharacterized protein n=1 Tax=Grimontia hollisae CIP 101886 TaxID=675812 RepID=D0I892_GRIHO|nr:hypothetical protein VHA_001967 [Grimontia hollisae CIP 101886]
MRHRSVPYRTKFSRLIHLPGITLNRAGEAIMMTETAS